MSCSLRLHSSCWGSQQAETPPVWQGCHDIFFMLGWTFIEEMTCAGSVSAWAGHQRARCRCRCWRGQVYTHFSKMVEIMKCIPPDVVTENLPLGDQIFWECGRGEEWTAGARCGDRLTWDDWDPDAGTIDLSFLWTCCSDFLRRNQRRQQETNGGTNKQIYPRDILLGFSTCERRHFIPSKLLLQLLTINPQQGSIFRLYSDKQIYKTRKI